MLSIITCALDWAGQYCLSIIMCALDCGLDNVVYHYVRTRLWAGQCCLSIITCALDCGLDKTVVMPSTQQHVTIAALTHCSSVMVQRTRPTRLNALTTALWCSTIRYLLAWLRCSTKPNRSVCLSVCLSVYLPVCFIDVLIDLMWCYITVCSLSLDLTTTVQGAA